MKIAVQCSSLGERCGIYTYTKRFVNHLNKLNNVEAITFVNKFKDKDVDIISVQYEPGILSLYDLQKILNKYASIPVIITAHFSGGLEQVYSIVDGVIFHSKSQIIGEPWDYTIIPHPALVYPEKGKEKMRKKYGLPIDKKIVGTAGFIAGTGKNLPGLVKYILKDLKDDEFLYLITSYWKGGDFSNERKIRDLVKKYGKENQFRIDTDFVSDEVLNEKMQACDLLFSWNVSETPGSNSGIAMDMLGARRKLIVKDAPHYSIAASIDGVEVGRKSQEEFAEDVLNLFRKGDLNNVPDPTPYSWESLTPKFVEYFEMFL